MYAQGQHAKTFGPLNERTVALECKELILSTDMKLRSLSNLASNINLNLIPEYSSDLSLGRVSKSTLQRYMQKWGFEYKRKTKNIYYDGHERPDVIDYRLKWSKEMLKYRERMSTFDVEISADGKRTVKEIEPNLKDGETKLVMVTQDESTFYCNEGNSHLWVLEDQEEMPLLPKGEGLSLMLSAFICSCHGIMVSPKTGKESRVFFEAGASRDGYWTAKHMGDQFEEVITIFEDLHPGCSGLFMFDNSSNHGSMPADALVASRMKGKTETYIKSLVINGKQMKVPNKKWYPFRNTEFTNSEGTKTEQMICT